MQRQQNDSTAPEASIYAAFLEAFFRELEARDVRYCVPRNFEGLPARIEGDVDVLVRRGQLRRAEAALENAAPGHFVLRRVRRNGHLLVWIGRADELRRASREGRRAEVLEVDLVTDLQWMGVPYQDAITVLSGARRERGIWVASPEDEASHILCHAILDKRCMKPVYRETIAAIVASLGAEAFAPLVHRVGAKIVGRLFEALQSGDDAVLLALRRDLIRGLLVTHPSAPPRWLGFVAARTLRRAGAGVSPPGVLIATAGPDGVGKSTLLANIRLVLEGTFEPVSDQYMGWREFVLPTKRLLSWLQEVLSVRQQGREKVPEKSATAALSSGHDEPEGPMSWTHNFSVLHYFVDLWARYLLQVRPALARGGLVLCDRYFFDVLVQEVLVCENPWLRGLLLALTPKPTVTALLSGDPEVIAARKHEMSAQKTARDMGSLMVLKGRRGVLDLDAQKPVEENLEAVLRGIFPRWRETR